MSQVLHVERVLAEPGEVGGVGEQAAVVADLAAPRARNGWPTGELVQVEHHLLRRLQAARLAAVDRVLLALLGARVVEEAAPPVGHRLVVFLDARQHLVVEAFLEALGRLHHRVGVDVLRRQVGGDLRVLAVPHPEVVVDADVAVDDVGLGHALGHRGRREGRRHAPNRTTGGTLARPAARSLHWLPHARAARRHRLSRGASTRASSGRPLERVRLANPFVLRSVDPPLAERRRARA